jgi:hypothetical protein
MNSHYPHPRPNKTDALKLLMHRCFTALAFLIVAMGCRERSVIEAEPKLLELPSMTIQAKPQEKSILMVTVSNPSIRELLIPGFTGDLIYGSYWYQGDKVISVPECGTGFWDSVIKIPAGQTRELRLLIPRDVTRGDRYTVAVVYSGLGSSLNEEGRMKVSPEEWMRHPDIWMNCRKMEKEVDLAEK